jgi:hypothetical protein
MQQIAEKNLVSVVLLNILSAQTTSPVLGWKKQVDWRSTIPARLGITAVTAGLLPRRRIMHNNLLHTNAQILIEAALSDRPKQF